METEMGSDRGDAALARKRSRHGQLATAGRVPADVMTAALALSLWIAFGSLTMAVVDGLGSDPERRLIIGLLLLLACACALALRSNVCALLESRPSLVIAVAVGLLAMVAVDGLVGGPYLAVSVTPIGIAVVAARARTVWICIALLMLGYAFGVSIDRSPAELSRDGQLGTAIGALAGYPVAGILLLGLRRRFTRFVDRVEPTLHAIRAGSPATTPALERALRAEPIALPAAPTSARLTATERRVVQGLADGLVAKELAFSWGVSINTVRTHISNAKRKTGARTLRELAGMPARPDWPVRDEL